MYAQQEISLTDIKQQIAQQEYAAALQACQSSQEKTPQLWACMAYCADKMQDKVMYTVYALRAGLLIAYEHEVNVFTRWILYVSPLILQIILLLFFLLFLYIVINFGFAYKKVLWVIGFIGIFLLVAWFVQVDYLSRTYAVCKNKVTLYAGPATSYYEVGRCEAAQLVQVVDKKDEWMQVRFGSYIGWMPQQEGIEV